MATETVSYADAKTITLEYYVKRRSQMPLPFRDAPFKKVENVVLSINDVIAAIQSDTELGQWLVFEYVGGLGMIISGI